MQLSEPMNNPDQFLSPVIGIGYEAAMQGYSHHHRRAQLMYCISGSFELAIENQLFIVSPSYAIWIPSMLEHCATSPSIVKFRSLYFDVDVYPKLPTHMHSIQVSPLLKQLIDKLCGFEDGYPAPSPQQRLADVVLDELAIAPVESFQVPLSEHPSIQAIYQYTLLNISSNEKIPAIAKRHCMSVKSMQRLFLQELGISFEQWRLQLKVIKAIELLSSGMRTTQVSQQLGYSNDSSFIAMFKRQTRKTPSCFKPVSQL